MRTSKWILYDLTEASCVFPEKPACYVIYLDGVLSYIGQARDIRSRLLTYKFRFGYGSSCLNIFGSFSSVKIKIRYGERFGDWAMRELRLIKRLQPPLNCVGSIKKRGAA